MDRGGGRGDDGPTLPSAIDAVPLRIEPATITIHRLLGDTLLLEGAVLDALVPQAPLVPAELRTPRPFRRRDGRRCNGYDADLVLEVCRAYIAAASAKNWPRRRRLMRPEQAELYVWAGAFLGASARRGLDALIAGAFLRRLS